MRYFTVEEAEALIPKLAEIFEAISEIAARADAKTESIRKLQADGSRVSELAIEKAQLQFLAGGMNDWFQKIVDLGAFPKGLDPALVDFPYRLGNKEVYLCWKLGEDRITHYHGLEEGFSGRKTLPKTFLS